MRRPPIKYSTGYSHRLEESWEFQTGIIGCAARIDSHDGGPPWLYLRQNGLMFFREGYSWNGCSGPTIDKPEAAAVPAGMVHDGGYQLFDAGKIGPDIREQFDNLFYRLLLQGGMWRWRALLWRRAVRKFGRLNEKRKPTEVRTV